MTTTTADPIVKRLSALRLLTPDVEAAAVISAEGLMIAASLPEELEVDRLAAMSAAMLALGERIADELGRGMLEQVFIKGELGYVLLMSLDENAVLTTLVGDDAKLGLIFLDMRRTASDLRQLI